MNPVVVMVTVSERTKALNNFLRTMKDHTQVRDIFIHMQGDKSAYHRIEIPDGITWDYIHSEQRLGCHAARVIAQQKLATSHFDTYINVDDDVELTEWTNWQPAMLKAHEQGVGFVLTNWVRHPNLLPAAVERLEDKFYPQIMVYNGGGMAYNNDVANLIRDLDPEPARYDDIWPITAYINGYKNYRYQGSQAIHRIMGRGGMNQYMQREPRPLLCWDYIDYKMLYGAKIGSEYSIPMDAQVRPSTKELHKKVRAEKGWD